MSLEIKNCVPISVFLLQDSVSLESMRGLLPDAIDIVAKYAVYSEAYGNRYLYRVIMPYKFNAPNNENPFGDRVDTVLKLKEGYDISVEEGTPVLAQDVFEIFAYEH